MVSLKILNIIVKYHDKNNTPRYIFSYFFKTISPVVPISPHPLQACMCYMYLYLYRYFCFNSLFQFTIIFTIPKFPPEKKEKGILMRHGFFSWKNMRNLAIGGKSFFLTFLH